LTYKTDRDGVHGVGVEPQRYPSEVDIEMVGNRENEHEMTTHEADIMTDAFWKGIGEGPMMMRTMMAAATRWNRLDDYR
jgi:hypothetical protein